MEIKDKLYGVFCFGILRYCWTSACSHVYMYSIDYLLGCYWLSMELCRIVMFRKREANNSFVGPLDRNVALVPQLWAKFVFFMLFFPSYPIIYITVYYERDYYLLLMRLFDHALQFILIHVRTSYINTYILNISYTSDPQFL